MKGIEKIKTEKKLTLSFYNLNAIILPQRKYTGIKRSWLKITKSSTRKRRERKKWINWFVSI